MHEAFVDADRRDALVHDNSRIVQAALGAAGGRSAAVADTMSPAPRAAHRVPRRQRELDAPCARADDDDLSAVAYASESLLELGPLLHEGLERTDEKRVLDRARKRLRVDRGATSIDSMS